MGPLFHQPLWLDAVAPAAWGAVEVDDGGMVVTGGAAPPAARLPYVIRRGRIGQRVVGMPSLTPSLGPWFAPLDGKPSTRLARQHELTAALIEGLPPFDVFEQRCHRSITNWLPFYWRGFEQTTRYTYVLENLSDLDAVWHGLRENIRREIRKAERRVVIRGDGIRGDGGDDRGADDLFDLCRATFRRQGRPVPFDRQTLLRVDRACRDHTCGRLLFAEDAAGRVHAGLLVVWDDLAAYYLVAGADPDLRTSGAASLLLWEAIRLASAVTRAFDFEGSMLAPIERFFRAFGAEQAPYFHLSKVGPRWLRAARDVRAWI